MKGVYATMLSTRVDERVAVPLAREVTLCCYPVARPALNPS